MCFTFMQQCGELHKTIKVTDLREYLRELAGTKKSCKNSIHEVVRMENIRVKLTLLLFSILKLSANLLWIRGIYVGSLRSFSIFLSLILTDRNMEALSEWKKSRTKSGAIKMSLG